MQLALRFVYRYKKKNSPFNGAAYLYNKCYLGTSGLIVWIKIVCTFSAIS